MNMFAAYPQAVPGGWRVMMRFAKDARPKPLMGDGEKPEVFPTLLEAHQAITENLLKYFNGHYLRCGDIAGNAKAEAEALFRPILHRAGKRPVVVERVRAKA